MHLEVTKDKDTQVFSFDKQKILIGRSKEADLRLQGDDVSRKHLYLELINGKYFVEDLGAANGVFVNQQRLPINTRTEVQTFFPIQVGSDIFIHIVEQEEAVKAAAAPPKERTAPINLQAPKSSDATKTRTRISNAKARPAPSAKKASSQNKNSLLLMALLLGGGGYYYYSQVMNAEDVQVSQEAPVTPTAPLSKSEEARRKTEVPLTPGQRREKQRLEAEFNRLCQTEEEKSICSAIRPELLGKEGARVLESENKLIIFRDLVATADSIWGREFSKIPPERKYDFMLSYMAIKKAKELNFRKVEIVDYKMEENLFLPMASVEIYKSALDQFPSDQINNILEKAKETGDLKPYDDTLRSTHVVGYFAVTPELTRRINK